jgi:hypothetical protein
MLKVQHLHIVNKLVMSSKIIPLWIITQTTNEKRDHDNFMLKVEFYRDLLLFSNYQNRLSNFPC